MCGKYIQDCNCHSSCESRGNCCFDYYTKQCLEKINNALDKFSQPCRQNDNCELCDKEIRIGNDPTTAYCHQCSADTYKYKGRCYKVCPVGTQINIINKICEQTCIYFVNINLLLFSMRIKKLS